MVPRLFLAERTRYSVPCTWNGILPTGNSGEECHGGRTRYSVPRTGMAYHPRGTVENGVTPGGC